MQPARPRGRQKGRFFVIDGDLDASGSGSGSHPNSSFRGPNTNPPPSPPASPEYRRSRPDTLPDISSLSLRRRRDRALEESHPAKRLLRTPEPPISQQHQPEPCTPQQHQPEPCAPQQHFQPEPCTPQQHRPEPSMPQQHQPESRTPQQHFQPEPCTPQQHRPESSMPQQHQPDPCTLQTQQMVFSRTPHPGEQQFLQWITPYPSFQQHQKQPEVVMPGAHHLYPQQLNHYHFYQQQQPRQNILYTKDGAAAGYNTKFEDLHPETQKILLQIEKHIWEYKDESEKLDQCSRLYDLSASTDDFGLYSEKIFQNLRGISIAIGRERVAVKELMSFVKKMLSDTSFAIRSFTTLKQNFLCQNVQTESHNSGFYSGLHKKPCIFIVNTVSRYEKQLDKFHQCIEELEQLLIKDTKRTPRDAYMTLQEVLFDLPEFFNYVASKVETLHCRIESLKKTFFTQHYQQDNLVMGYFLRPTEGKKLKNLLQKEFMQPSIYPQASHNQPTSLLELALKQQHHR